MNLLHRFISGSAILQVCEPQIMKNMAVQLLSRASWQENIPPVLKQMVWLPIYYQLQFKILLMTFKALHGLWLCLSFPVHQVPCPVALAFSHAFWATCWLSEEFERGTGYRFRELCSEVSTFSVLAHLVRFPCMQTEVVQEEVSGELSCTLKAGIQFCDPVAFVQPSQE